MHTMKAIYFIPFVVTGLLLIQCKSIEEKPSEIPTINFEILSPPVSIPLNSRDYPKAVSIYGEWTYQSDNVWYSATLTVNKNGSFKYLDQSCFGKDSTEGSWVDNGFSQVFTSFDKYKEGPALMIETSELHPKIQKSTSKNSSKQSKFIIDTSFINRSLLSTTVITRLAGKPNLYFDRKSYRFIDGFLFELDQHGSLTGEKYYQTKNYR